MEIVEIEKSEVMKIKGLWNQLNALHWEKSSHFKSHFESFTFKKRIERLFAKKNVAIFAAQINSDEPVGYCMATENEGVGEIDSIFVKDEFRGNGFGKKLTQKAITWLDRFHCHEINVRVAEGNESVLLFYEQFGFKERFRVLQIQTPEYK